MARAQALMSTHALDALLVTTAPNVRYFSGLDTQFWDSPTRPWFLVLPRTGPPVAVIPEIGAPALAATWVDDVRTWPAPRPADDGVSLLAEALASVPRRHGRIGAELGRESCVRMPVLDLRRVESSLAGTDIVDGTPVVRAARMDKSEAEIDRIRHVCGIVCDGFDALHGALAVGDSERDACRRLRIDLLERGADHSPYLIGVSGPGGYDNVITGPTDRRLAPGDVLVIDTGTT